MIWRCVEIDLPHGWSTGRYTKYGTEIHGYDDNGDQETYYVTDVNVEERLIQVDGQVFRKGLSISQHGPKKVIASLVTRSGLQGVGTILYWGVTFLRLKQSTMKNLSI